SCAHHRRTRRAEAGTVAPGNRNTGGGGGGAGALGRCRARDRGCGPAEPIHSGGRLSESAGGAPRIRGSGPPAPAATQNDQFVTSVVIRLGTSPTGMTALTVLLSVSMAGTDLMAALEV